MYYEQKKVETGRREDAGGIETHGRQIGDEAHD
jgi:hypothetical protein